MEEWIPVVVLGLGFGCLGFKDVVSIGLTDLGFVGVNNNGGS